MGPCHVAVVPPAFVMILVTAEVAIYSLGGLGGPGGLGGISASSSPSR